MDNQTERPDTGRTAIGATLQFETDSAWPLEVCIFVDRTTANRELQIARLECGPVWYEYIVGNADTLTASDETWLVRQMLEVIRDCSHQSGHWNYASDYFKKHGVLIGREIVDARAIQYGYNKERKWPDFPGKFKEMFDAAGPRK